MGHFTIPVLSLSVLIALFGCTQQGIPPACANASAGTLSNCIYLSSVLQQNPYGCYSIASLPQREKCLRDASDSTVQKLVEQMSPADRAKIFAAIPEAADAPGASIPYPPLPPASEPAAPGALAEIISPPSGVSEEDSQSYVQAIEANDMAPCTTIVDASTRASCITQVALRVKNPAMCAQFTQKSDIDLCSLYAKAGEQAK